MSLVGVVIMVTSNKSQGGIGSTAASMSYPISAIILIMMNPISNAIVNIALRQLKHLSIHPSAFYHSLALLVVWYPITLIRQLSYSFVYDFDSQDYTLLIFIGFSSLGN